MGRLTCLGCVAAATVAAAGCGYRALAEPQRAPRPPALSLTEFRSGLARLAEIRDASSLPRTLRVSIRVSSPSVKRALAARGAVAISPPDSLRMILLGPAGTTALDLWIGGDRFRVAVPAIGLKQRGKLTDPAMGRRGVPVTLLRYWLLRPARGRLLWLERSQQRWRYVLRDGDALNDLVVWNDGHLGARLSAWSSRKTAPTTDEESLSAAGVGCASAQYSERSTGLSVSVFCEGESLGLPSPRALADPDGEQQL
jgi:hypothetical protein